MGWNGHVLSHAMRRAGCLAAGCAVNASVCSVMIGRSDIGRAPHLIFQTRDLPLRSFPAEPVRFHRHSAATLTRET